MKHKYFCIEGLSMGKTYSSVNFFINGPSGDIEAVTEKSDNISVQGVIIICHPHPLFGGTMQNKVVHTISRACLNKNLMVLRFNFRGVGYSEGTFDDGIGEVDDALCVIKYVQHHYPDLPVWLGGFSFGGGVAIQAAVINKPIALISIAPSLSNLNMLAINEPGCPWLIVHGAQDELIQIKTVKKWLKPLKISPTVVVLDEATHFFHGCLIKLRMEIESFIESKVKHPI